MATSQAALLIAQLQAQGLSRSSIARAIGRDASIISQIANGKKSGSAYVSALQNLTSGATQVNVPRRQTKAGTQAKVRGGAIRDEENRVINVVTSSPDGTQVKNLLKKIEKNDGRIGVVISFRKYQAYEMPVPAPMDVALWSNGTSARWINRALTSMTFSELLTEQVNSAYEPTLAEGVISVQINAIY